MVSPSVSVVVPTRERAARLQSLVAAVLDQRLDRRDRHGVEIVVVDDASRDDTWATLRALQAADSRLVPLRLSRHSGPASARNLGWRTARAEIVVFTDDDCLPEPGWLAALLAEHAKGADLVQGRTLPDVEEYWERGSFAHWVEVPTFSHLYETCNVSYRRTLLEALSGFDESFGTSRGGAPNGEDADLGWRAEAAGARTAFAAGAVVRHPVTRSSYPRYLKARLRAHRMVYFVRHHPGYREYLPRRHVFQRSHPAALLALAGWSPVLVTGQAWLVLVGIASCAPYVYVRRRVHPLPGRRRHQGLIILAAWVADILEIAVLATGSLRWRRLLL